MHLETALAGRGRDWEAADTTGTVRFAVVGVGGFARGAALPALAAADYCTPSVLVSGSDPADVAAEYGCRTIGYDEYAAGEASDDYDAVYVATPNAHHADHIATAAALGKGVVTEKPLADTPANAERAVRACAEAGVPLMTAYRLQCDPVLRALRRFVAEGGLGRVAHVHGDFSFPALGGSRGPEQWRIDPALAGGGALFDVGVYPLNTTRFLLDADPVAVTGRVHAHEPYTGVVADDGDYRAGEATTAFTVEFPGSLGSFTASFDAAAGSTLTLTGTDARLRLDDAFQPGRGRRLTLERGAETVRYELADSHEVREEFDYFAHHLLTDGASPLEPDGEDGLTDVRAMAAVYEAAATGRTVTLD